MSALFDSDEEQDQKQQAPKSKPSAKKAPPKFRPPVPAQQPQPEQGQQQEEGSSGETKPQEGEPEQQQQQEQQQKEIVTAPEHQVGVDPETGNAIMGTERKEELDFEAEFQQNQQQENQQQNQPEGENQSQQQPQHLDPTQVSAASAAAAAAAGDGSEGGGYGGNNNNNNNHNDETSSIASSIPTNIPTGGGVRTVLSGAPQYNKQLPQPAWTSNETSPVHPESNNAIQQFQQQQVQRALPNSEWSAPVMSSSSQQQQQGPKAEFGTNLTLGGADPVPSPVVVAPDPPLTLQMPPPVQMPASETAPSAVLLETQKMTPAWDAFDQLRKTLEESHQRLLNIHGEISKTQVSHEDEAAEYRRVTETQLDTQRKEIQSLTDKLNQTQANLDHCSGVLMRKSQEIMELEQRVYEAQVAKASVVQKAAHTEDKAKLSDKLRMAADVRATELELSLEHATTLLTSMRKQLNSANDDKTEALQRQYKMFEENRQQLIQFYSEREKYVLAAFNDSIQRSHAQLAERERAREAQVIAHWQAVSRGQIEELKSLVEENKKRADAHAKEVAELKEAQEEEKQKYLLHLQNEIQLADARAASREKNLVADLTKREREMSEREQKMRVQFAQAEQEAKLQLIAREAELKATYDKLLEDLRSAYDSDREKTVAGFREQLAAIASQHLQNERELEKMHREKEREMGQRYRIAGYEAEDQKQKSELENVTTKTTGSLLAKFDNYALREKERVESTRSKLLTGNAAKTSTSLSQTQASLNDASSSASTLASSLTSTSGPAMPPPMPKTSFSNVTASSTGGVVLDSKPSSPSSRSEKK